MTKLLVLYQAKCDEIKTQQANGRILAVIEELLAINQAKSEPAAQQLVKS